MPGWAGSSWYDLRYMDAQNEEVLVSEEKADYWRDVDLYIGGNEHATGHLLYTRFWHKFLKDRGIVKEEEPFKKLINQGMILGYSAFAYRVVGENTFVSAELADQYPWKKIHVDVNMVNASDELDTEAFKAWRDDLASAKLIFDGAFKVTREVEKMSKSKFNVVNPDDIIAQYGADTLRLYEMFLGPLEQSKPWNTAGISGVHNFLRKLWRLYFKEGELTLSEEKPDEKELKVLHTLIKKVKEDINNFSFNTTVSAFMIAVNGLTDLKCNKRGVLETLPILISPFAPHIAEELWNRLGHTSSIAYADFPQHEEKFLTESNHNYPVSFNGKMRFTHQLPLDLNKEEIEKAIMALERTQQYLEGKTIRKVIIVPGKIVNIVAS